VPSSGVLERVHGEDAARAIRGIEEFMITASLHYFVAALLEVSSYLGFLFARGHSAEDVERALLLAHAYLMFCLVVRLPVEHPTINRAGRA